MNPQIQERLEWARSANGSPIDLYASPDFKWGSEQRPLVMIGGVHGDEPEGVWLAEHTLQWLKSVVEKTPNEVHVPWLLIPCLNPDGIKKNDRVNGNRVDLNRNFPNSNWSPDFKQERYYPGSKPASESETQAVLKIIEDYNPQMIIHFHSWVPCIVLTGSEGRNCADYLVESSGYPFKPDIGYPTPGSLGDYAWYEKRIPVICVEVQEKIEREKIWPLFAGGMAKVLKNGVLSESQKIPNHHI